MNFVRTTVESVYALVALFILGRAIIHDDMRSSLIITLLVCTTVIVVTNLIIDAWKFQFGDKEKEEHG